MQQTNTEIPLPLPPQPTASPAHPPALAVCGWNRMIQSYAVFLYLPNSVCSRLREFTVRHYFDVVCCCKCMAINFPVASSRINNNISLFYSYSCVNRPLCSNKTVPNRICLLHSFASSSSTHPSRLPSYHSARNRAEETTLY